MSEEKTNKSIHAGREERILAYWKEKGIFEKTLKKESPQGEYTFFEGPPTANGMPGIHHLESRSFKDIFPRYKTMRGFHVPRKAGWDTHGLPVELKIEKDLGLDSKKKIEEYGIAPFNKKCKESVHDYVDAWAKFTERIGYWTDLDNAYFTYTPKYIESVWKVLSHVNDRGLIYKDYKVVPWCPRCGTGLSSHELGQPEAYVDVKDLSVTAKFKVVGQENTYLLAWTTTPWTLPGNVGLAVGEEIEYSRLKINNEELIIAKARVPDVLKDVAYEEIETLKGGDLVGLSYEPLFPYLANLNAGDEKMQNAYKVYAASFVNTEDGTGIVHTAVMYGADDFDLGTKVGLPKFHLVDETGHFIQGMDFLSGRYVKEKDEAGKPTLAVEILDDLKGRNLFFSQENIKHSYPHCWRCKTPLIYYARDSWYIRMSEVREQLIEENKKINWEPSHIRDGRMGEWLSDVKDWAISRERYWGTPLPIWVTEDGEETMFVDSYEKILEHAKHSGNRYFVMRHGESDSNVGNICSSDPNYPHHLTEKGKEQVRASAELLKDKGITRIYTSPFVRTRESSRIVAETLGMGEENIVVDDRLHELNFGDYHLQSFDDFMKYRQNHMLTMGDKLPGGESYQDAKDRVGDFLKEIESTVSNEIILIVAHGVVPEVIPGIVEGADAKRSRELVSPSYLEKGEMREFAVSSLPRNNHYELDPHRPYIDEVVLISPKSGKEMRRIKEVADVWLDSGAMPFAQDADTRRENTFDGISYPADFISEAIDQTRGWFYTLLAEGVLMGRGTPYKNVICLGHLLDKDGKKMSKSLGNIVEPWGQMDKYGVDALRMWMYTVSQPGDSKNYDEKTVDEIVKKVFLILSNCIVFYETYKGEATYENSAEEVAKSSSNILDKWVIALFHKMLGDGTGALDAYDTFRSARAIRDFCNDFSTWYIRRSRDRFKSDDVEDRNNALATTQYILTEFSKYLAPFAPFFAEEMYLKVTEGMSMESVHLEDWPKGESVSEELERENILTKMENIRKLVTLGLEARQRAGIKVRQPLAKITITNHEFDSQYLDLLKDEINVKEVLFDKSLPEDGAVLDTEITAQLKEEGIVREFTRSIQDLRKENGLTPKDRIVLSLDVNNTAQEVLEKYLSEIKSVVQADEVRFESNDGQSVNIEGLDIKVKFV